MLPSALDFQVGLARRSARGLALVAALLACACASKLPRTPQTFTIDPPAPRPVPAATATRVISLRRVEAAATYAGSELVYRVSEHGIERDPYASLAAPPAFILTSAIRGYLRDTDFIRDVVAPGEGPPIDAEIEPALTELFGDFSNPAEPAAVLSLHFRVLARAAGSATTREVLLKNYTRRIPLSQRTAVAVVAAWNRALGEIMGEFLPDLKAVLPPRP
jgi:cholesterol transport system auxiliary component